MDGGCSGGGGGGGTYDGKVGVGGNGATTDYDGYVATDGINGGILKKFKKK